MLYPHHPSAHLSMAIHEYLQKRTGSSPIQIRDTMTKVRESVPEANKHPDKDIEIAIAMWAIAQGLCIDFEASGG